MSQEDSVRLLGLIAMIVTVLGLIGVSIHVSILERKWRKPPKGGKG